MMNVLVKLGPRIPELLARAAAGDPTAIVILGIAGVAAVSESLKNK